MPVSDEDFAAMQLQVSSMEATLSTLQGQISTLQGQMATAQTFAVNLNQRLNQAENRLDATRDFVRRLVRRLVAGEVIDDDNSVIGGVQTPIPSHELGAVSWIEHERRKIERR